MRFNSKCSNVSPGNCEVEEDGWNKVFCLLLIILALGFSIMLSCSVFTDADDTCADNFTVDGIKYKTTAGMTVQVIGCKHPEDLVIPSSVIHDGKDYRVTSISNCTFQCSESLRSVTIGDEVTSIDRATFFECGSLTSVVIGKSVKTIGSYAFNCCTKLTSVTFGNSVTSIGESAFFGCKSLRSMAIPGSVESIGQNAFRDCESMISVVISDGVKSIGWSAFRHCILLVYITLSDTVRTVSEGMCEGCRSLTVVTIGNSVRSIGEYAFLGCISLTSVTIPDSVKSIGENAFLNCKSLTSVTFGNNVKTIGKDAFGGCKFYNFDGKKKLSYSKLHGYTYCGEKPSKLIRLHNINFDENGGSVKVEKMSIGEGKGFVLPGYTGTKTAQTFVGWLCDGEMYYAGHCISKVCSDMRFTAVWGAITFTVDGLRYEATSDTAAMVIGCDRSGDIVIPSSVTYSGKEFSVTSIGEFAFYQCKTLTSVTIPSSVRSIDRNAFDGCKFYDSDGKTEITDYTELSGYCYSGDSSWKLVRHEISNIVFEGVGCPAKV